MDIISGEIVQLT